MPQHAYVFVDKGEYFAPPFLMREFYDIPEAIEIYAKVKNVELKRYEEVKKLYKPNKDCVNMEFFIEEGRSLSGLLLEKIGVFSPFSSRWNQDGSWAY